MHAAAAAGTGGTFYCLTYWFTHFINFFLVPRQFAIRARTIWMQSRKDEAILC